MLTTNYVPGVPSWVDLGSPDVTRSAGHYRGVFGWTFHPLGPSEGEYGVFRHDGRTVAAVGPLPEHGARSAWTVYFHTADADATARAVAEAGGEVRVEPFDVFSNGRMAQLTDPGGADFAIWQPRDTAGLDEVTGPGSLGWVELQAPDPAGVHDFYRSVFGWTVTTVPADDGDYTVFTPEHGDDDSSFGGIADLQEGQQAHWLPYFEVTDTDAAVSRNAALGGRAVLPTGDLPGVGRMAWLEDPFGARCAVITSSTD
ncbi:VOC family protein [Saccharothrix sp. Mg75]|uniref:VOC family protein n=1 Tax=Saccharothrix sp. Mg75 TaxID=3445357 RepID=UPI003EECAD30